MCWSEEVSLRTFIFTSLMLLVIYLTNKYSTNKLEEFKNNYLYFLIFSFTVMQLIEYFLWKSINTKNKIMNSTFSVLGWFVIFIIQPIGILFGLSDKYILIRNSILFCYIFSFVVVNLYKGLYNPFNFITTVSDGHLKWEWFHLEGYEKILGLFYFICFSTLLFQYPVASLLIFSLLFFSYYFNNITWGSNWCFYSNSILLYYLLKILYIQFQRFQSIS